jgi:hypothetical protein
VDQVAVEVEGTFSKIGSRRREASRNGDDEQGGCIQTGRGSAACHPERSAHIVHAIYLK